MLYFPFSGQSTLNAFRWRFPHHLVCRTLKRKIWLRAFPFANNNVNARPKIHTPAHLQYTMYIDNIGVCVLLDGAAGSRLWWLTVHLKWGGRCGRRTPCGWHRCCLGLVHHVNHEPIAAPACQRQRTRAYCRSPVLLLCGVFKLGPDSSSGHPFPDESVVYFLRSVLLRVL